MTDDPRDPTPPGADRDDHSASGRGRDPHPRTPEEREPTSLAGTGEPTDDGPPDTVDELASAVIDGELGGDEARAALRRPDVAARVSRLAAARDAVSSDVPPPDAARRDRAIDAALGAFDTAGTSGAAVRPRTPIPGDQLAAARAARTARSAGSAGQGRAARWLGAAAAAIVVAVLGVVIARSGGLSDSETASDDAAETSEPLEATEDQADAGADGDGGDEAASSEDAASEPVAPGDAGPGAAEHRAPGGVALGTFASAEALLDAAAGTLDWRATGAPTDVGALQDRCTDGVPGVVAGTGDRVRLVAWGTVDGVPVEAWLGSTGDDPLLVALDPHCSVLATRPAP
jgi:hypothetical protein